MRAIYAKEEAGNGTYDASRAKGGGRKAEIQDFTPQADVVYNALECGMSVGNSLVLLNAWRRHPERGLAENPGRDSRKTDCTETSILAP